jgi:hypothetical protein
MHRITETNSLVDAAFENQFLDSMGDVHEAVAAFDFEP